MKRHMEAHDFGYIKIRFILEKYVGGSCHDLGMQVLYMDQHLRGKLSFSLDSNKIFTSLTSLTCPQLNPPYVFVRGTASEMDNILVKTQFDNEEDFKQAYADIIKLFTCASIFFSNKKINFKKILS